MAHAHRAGSLKQRNKPFKKRTAAPAPVSATAFRAAERRKAAAPALAAAVRAINKQQRGLQTKHKRSLQLQRLQRLKQSLRGSAACDHAALPPRVVLVVSFNKSLPSSCVCAALGKQLAADAPETSRVAKRATAVGPVAAAAAERQIRQRAQTGLSEGAGEGNSAGAQSAAPAAQNLSAASCGRESDKGSGPVLYSREHVRNSGVTTAPSIERFVHALPSYACCPSLSQRTQQRVLLLPAPCPEELLQLLTLCTCADLLLCVFAGECTYTAPAFDEDGYRFLAALRMQGVPPVTGVGLSPSTLNTFLASPISQQQQQREPRSDNGAANTGVEDMQAEMDTADIGAEGTFVAATNINKKKEKENESLHFQQRYFLSEFGKDKRFVMVRTSGDWRKVLRAVGSAHIPPDVAAAPSAPAGGDLHWRKGRGYLLALDWRLLTETQLQQQKFPKMHAQQQQQMEPIERMYLQVDGFVRGVGFTKRLPIHVTGVGNFIAQRIEVLHSTPHVTQKSLSILSNAHSSHICSDSSTSCVNSSGSSDSTSSSRDGSSMPREKREADMQGEGRRADEDKGIEELDCEELSAVERSELLQLIQPLQPFDRSSLEQTWPTEAELQLTELQQRNQNQETLGREEECGGPFDEVSGQYGEGEEKAEEHSDDQVDGRWNEEFVTSNKDIPDLPTLHSSDAKRNYTIEQRAAEDLEFPDEVDTPLNIEARIRFQKYRGLKSFRTSTWNREMDLPLEYSRIVDFQRLKSLQTYAFATLRNLCARNIFQGRFCRITIPLHFISQSLDSAAVSAATCAPTAAAAPASTAACSCCLELPSSQYSSPASWEQLLLRCSGQPLLARTVQHLRHQLAALSPTTSSFSYAASSCLVRAPTSSVSAADPIASPAAATCVAGLRACAGKEEGQLPPHLVLSTLLPFETAVSVTHMSLTRGGGGAGNTEDLQRRSIKSKEEVLFACGFRRFLARPIFSTVAATSASNSAAATEKAKYLPFFHPSSSCIASLYCCTMFPPATVLAFVRSKQQLQPQAQQLRHYSLQLQHPQQQRHPQQDQVSDAALAVTAPAAVCGTWSVFAWGSVLHSSSNRIILKRIVLTGYPFRVHKRKAVVRYMFFNPRDIRWFMPVELHTKKGLRGNILQPLGTHGYMKCRFNLPIKQDDTVCMHLYKRVFPKWYPPSWNGHINQLPDNECYTETTRQEHEPQQESALQQQNQQQEPSALSEIAEMVAQ